MFIVSALHILAVLNNKYCTHIQPSMKQALWLHTNQYKPAKQMCFFNT